MAWLVLPAVPAAAAAPVALGTAEPFAVLAGSGITNTGATTIDGDVGSFPTPTQVGFGTITQTGTNHHDDAVTQQAKTDLTTAYNQAAGSAPDAMLPPELGGLTLVPGVYQGTTLEITGTLTLDALGDPDAVFIFQANQTLVTATASAVEIVNGGLACNVFWQVGSSATLGTSSRLIGSVLASTSITATTGTSIEGRLLAQNGAVTLDNTSITSPTCAAVLPTTTASPTTTATSPASTSTALPAGATTLVTGVPLGGPTDGSTTGVTTPGAGGPPPGMTTTQLAVTGTGSRLLLVGLLLSGLGLVLAGLSNQPRRRPR